MNYIAITFNTTDKNIQSLIIASLNEENYNGVEEEDSYIKIYFEEPKYNKDEIDAIAEQHQLVYEQEFIQKTNWNESWESNFDPVIIDDFCAIRAHFHSPIDEIQHEILITPKMSFGTGHHATTESMIRLMSQLDFHNKTVFDYGTGTGVLAILAEKLGAKDVLAIDIDEWSIENTLENVSNNHCSRIISRQGTLDVVKEDQFDIILANINRNILLDSMEKLSKLIVPQGYLLLSGILFDEDVEDIIAAASEHFQKVTLLKKDKWSAVLFQSK